MTDNKRHALAHDWPLQVPLSDEAEAALRGVVEAHLDAFDAALEPFGLSMSDVLLPTWMRAVYVEDVVAFGPPPSVAETPLSSVLVSDAWHRYARGELTYDEAMLLGGPLAEPVPEDSLATRLSSPASVADVAATEAWPGEAAERSAAQLPLLGAPRAGGSTGCASGGCSSCSAETAAAPAVDGVYVTDQLRDPEPFGERIDDGKLSREEAIAAGLLTEDGEPSTDALGAAQAAAVAGHAEEGCSGCAAIHDVAQSIGGQAAPREVFPEPRQDSQVFGGPGAPAVDLMGALRSSVDRARAFQAEADRDGYGR